MAQKSFQWLIRIDTEANLRRLNDGIIRFSIPYRWRKDGNGMNDFSEGVLAIEEKYEKSTYRLGTTRNINDICCLYNNEKRYIFDKRIDFVPTLCFYSFEYGTDFHELPRRYFNDFAHDEKNYDFIVVEANKFAERVKEGLTAYGFKPDDLAFQSVRYVKKDTSFSNTEMFPYELMYKDEEKYGYQHEVRFFIKSNDNEALRRLQYNDYCVKINMEGLIKGFHPIPSKNEIATFTKEGESFLLEIKEKD